MSELDAAVTAAEYNYLESWRLLAGLAPNGVVDESDGVLLTSIPVPVAFFNVAFVKPQADPRDAIGHATAFFGDKGLPFCLRCRVDDNREAVAAACADAGLRDDGTTPLMVASIADVDVRVDGDVRVVDTAHWRDHVTVLGAAFGMPSELLSQVMAPALFDAQDFMAFVTYDDDTPTSTAALIVSGDIAGVYNVGTPEPYRRRGLGEMVTRAAVAEGARRGCTLTTLQASDMGYPIYERMGYRTVARWSSYTNGAE